MEDEPLFLRKMEDEPYFFRKMEDEKKSGRWKIEGQNIFFLFSDVFYCALWARI